jgi:signal transduction histidine kinase
LGLAVFLLGSSLVGFSSGHPLTYLVFPSLIWAALRFGLAGATAANAVTAVTAVGLTAHERGPFAVSSIDDAVLGVQLFVLIAAVTTLTLGAVVSARRRAAWELAQSERREAEQATLARQRIARDLHDSVSQTLFGLTLQAGVAEHQLSAGRPGQTVELVHEISRLARGALAELRALIFELRPEALAEEGLVAALTKHGAALTVQRDIAIRVQGPGHRLTLPAIAEEHLYRLAQEAMGNAASHAHASAINVTVAEVDGHVSIGVTDDGCGFDPTEDYVGHLGLRTMRGRAAEIGGTLTIESRPGFGSTVSVSLPALSDVATEGE